jgi:hypothetical protein
VKEAVNALLKSREEEKQLKNALLYSKAKPASFQRGESLRA